MIQYELLRVSNANRKQIILRMQIPKQFNYLHEQSGRGEEVMNEWVIC